MSAPAPVLIHHADSNAKPGRTDRNHERAEALIAAVQDCSDAERRAELRRQAVLLTLDLADGVARRFRGRGMEVEDLVQVGRVALLKAAHGYRCGCGRSFAAYAVPTIAGEIKRHFRDNAWAVRPPRRLQELRAWQEEQLRHTLLHDPTEAEFARRLGLTRSDVRDAHACSRAYRAVSLDTSPGAGVSDQVSDKPGVDDLVAERDLLVWALERLSDRERLILRLRFVEEQSQSDIGVVLGVSQMQVSRLLAGILAKLRHDLVVLAA